MAHAPLKKRRTYEAFNKWHSPFYSPFAFDDLHVITELQKERDRRYNYLISRLTREQLIDLRKHIVDKLEREARIDDDLYLVGMERWHLKRDYERLADGVAGFDELAHDLEFLENRFPEKA